MNKQDIYKLSAVINEFNEQYIKENTAQSFYPTGYYVTDNAPNSWQALKEFKTCNTLPVYAGGSDNTIYKHAYQNYNFRFVHDLHHLKSNSDFSFHGECTAISKHYNSFKNWIQNIKGNRAIRYRNLFLIDTIGQVEYYYSNKDYVINQIEFAIDMMRKTKPEYWESIL